MPRLPRPTTAPAPYRRIVPVLYVIAVAVGLKYGFDFGLQVGGILLGTVMALNAALFTAILLGVVVDRTIGHRQPAADATEPGPAGSGGAARP